MKLQKDILEKIEKLLNLAREGSGGTDPERATARKMAHEIMEKYGLTVNEKKYAEGEIELVAVPEAKAKEVEALKRALNHVSFYNYATIIDGFMAKGIPANEIIPRQNIFTFDAWKALGRVPKGKKIAVRVSTVKTGKKVNRETGEEENFKFWGGANVFHVSDTVPLKAEYNEVSGILV